MIGVDTDKFALPTRVDVVKTTVKKAAFRVHIAKRPICLIFIKNRRQTCKYSQCCVVFTNHSKFH